MATQSRAPTSDNSTAPTIAYSSGTTGYNLVNDYPDSADPLTSYVELGTTANSAILFNFTAFTIPWGSTSISVAVEYYDEEPSNGTNSSDGYLRVGGTNYASGTTHNPSTTTTARSKTFANNPKTTAAWTVDQINGLDGTNSLQAFGVIGPDSNPVWRLGAIRCTVTYTEPTPPPTGALSLAGVAPTISGQKVITPSVGAIAATGTGPTANLQKIPETGSLSLAGVAPTLSYQNTPTPGAGSLSLTGLAPTVTPSLAAQIYFVIGPTAGWATPTPTEIKAGQLSGGGGATKSGNETSPVTSQTYTFSAAVIGLTSATGYTIAFVWSDGSNNSNVAEGSFTTQTAAADVTPSTGNLVLTGYAPSVSKQTTIAVNVGALNLAGTAPTLSRVTEVTPSVGSLVLTGYAPTAALGVGVTPTTGALSFAGYASSVLRSFAVTPGVGSLSFNGYAPAPTLTLVVTPSAGALNLTGYAPTLQIVTAGQSVPNAGSLNLTGYAPSLSIAATVTPSTGALSLAGYAVTPEKGSFPSVGTLSLTGYAPTVVQIKTIEVGVGSLTLTEYAPTIDRTGSVEIIPEAGSLSIQGYVPTIDNSEVVVVVPSGEKPAGKPKKRKRRYQVEIDGEVIEVSSVDEAQAILDEVRAKAEETAKLAISRAVKAKRKPAREVIKDARKALQVPEISVPDSLQDYATRMVDQIKAQYESALRSIEIGALLARQDYILEQDDEEILMLL